MWKSLLICLLILTPAASLPLMSQQNMPTPQEALSAFKAEKYNEALQMYERLLERNNRDQTYNYYYGVSLFKLNKNQDEAIQRLRLAAARPPSQDVHFYLGQLYQRAFELDLAITHYERFLAQQRTENEMTKTAKRAIEDCKASRNIINKYFDIKIIRKDTIPKDQLLNYYNLSKDAGQLLKAGDFFRVGVNPEQVIFRTERANEVYFPIMSSDKTFDLYKVVRLLDSWTDAELLPEPVNSAYNDLFPFLLIDGTTLYFSSDRPGGMGGLDIYQSTFDPVSGTFSEPSNLGPPFNTADDDFLLVPDIYAGKAWFATNRGIDKSKVIVTELVWDKNVVRYFTDNVSQIKTLSQLPLSPDAVVRSSSTLNATNDTPAADKNEVFRFSINDTLVYTKYEHFMSADALKTFRQTEKSANKRDSLYYEMNQRRKAYSQSYNQQDLMRLIDEIVALERQVYSLDEEVNRNHTTVRRLELERIRQLMREGRYAPQTNVRPTRRGPKSANQLALEDLNKGEFTFYSDGEFTRNSERLNGIYKHFFNQTQVEELQRSDSLYVWANILSLEAARTLESARNIPVQQPTLRDRINNRNGEEEENYEMKAMINKSRLLKQRSLSLYEQALDEKFAIYYPVAMEFGASSNQIGSEDMIHKATSRFMEAEEGIKAMSIYNPERYERLLSLKRQGVDMMEESLLIQIAGAPRAEPAQTEIRSTRFMDIQGAIQPSYPVIHKGDDIITPAAPPTPTPVQKPAAAPQPQANAASVVASAFTPAPQSQNVEYKIQIGVFRNEPNASALSKIPPVTKELLPESGLHKYFSGSWHKHVDAQSKVQSIRDAGFPGAFVVAFSNGVAISLDEAKKLEK